MCMTDQENQYYPQNMIVYVLCHEYAHVLCAVVDEEEHSDEFHEIFDELLLRAEQLGMYDPTILPLTNYCLK